MISPPDLDQLRTWDRDHVWHPFTPLADWEASDPLVIERGDGVYLFDTEGNRYIDGVSSLWLQCPRSSPPPARCRAPGSGGKIAHSTLLGVTHPAAIELARRLVEVPRQV